MKEKRVLLVVLIVLIAVSVTTTLTIAQGPTGTGQPRAPRTALGTGFTYQGQLKNGGSVVNGTCDLQFGLWDDESAGTRQGVTQTVTANVTNGLFTTVLNSGGEFGASAFDGTARWLAMAVRCPNGIGSYTALTSRQALTPAPYALYATNSSTAANATTATNFSGVLSGDVTGTQSSTTVTKLQGRTVASTAPTNGQVLKYDGTQWAPGTDNAASYQNVIVVAKSGGNYTTISDALSNISGNNATNRYLIWVAPGTYTETVTMKEYVDIEGAGEIATKITYTGSASSYTGTVVGATNAELRFLTVESTGGNTFASAISNGSASPRLTHLTATASGGTFRNYGVFNGSSSPTMTNVSATGSGGRTATVCTTPPPPRRR